MRSDGEDPVAEDQTTTGDAIANWAGWYNQGGSDKVWGGAVQGATFRSVWGKRGGSLARGEKVLATARATTPSPSTTLGPGSRSSSTRRADRPAW